MKKLVDRPGRYIHGTWLLGAVSMPIGKYCLKGVFPLYGHTVQNVKLCFWLPQGLADGLINGGAIVTEMTHRP